MRTLTGCEAAVYCALLDSIKTRGVPFNRNELIADTGYSMRSIDSARRSLEAIGLVKYNPELYGTFRVIGYKYVIEGEPDYGIMTRNEIKVYTALCAFIRKKQYLPSAVDLESIAGVSRHIILRCISSMQDKGLVSKLKFKRAFVPVGIKYVKLPGADEYINKRFDGVR